jgi:hypothetical protein
LDDPAVAEPESDELMMMSDVVQKYRLMYTVQVRFNIPISFFCASSTTALVLVPPPSTPTHKAMVFRKNFGCDKFLKMPMQTILAGVTDFDETKFLPSSCAPPELINQNLTSTFRRE